MAQTKTLPGTRSVADYLATVTHPVRRADADTLIAMMERVSGEPAVMWGPSILGFGSVHYRYESGHEGDICRIGFSPRSGHLVLYLLNGFPDQAALLVRLGKHKLGKGCLYVNKLADVDMAVLEEMATAAWANMARLHPA